jgi:hypothetical protein
MRPPQYSTKDVMSLLITKRVDVEDPEQRKVLEDAIFMLCKVRPECVSVMITGR